MRNDVRNITKNNLIVLADEMYIEIMWWRVKAPSTENTFA
jgi:hypothetical protein